MEDGDLEWGGGGPKVLLLHGFSGRPSDLREIGTHLASLGFHCLAPQLPGHERDLSGLSSATAEDWHRSARAALKRLREGPSALDQGERVAVIGFSLGGALAIHLAATCPEEVGPLILLAPALVLTGSSQLYRHLFRWRIVSWLIPSVKKGPPDLKGEGALPAYRGAGRLSTRGAALLDSIIRTAWESLPQVRCEALVVWGAKDRVVPFEGAKAAAEGIGSAPAPLVVLPASGHHLALDVERAQLQEEIVGFLVARDRRDTQ